MKKSLVHTLYPPGKHIFKELVDQKMITWSSFNHAVSNIHMEHIFGKPTFNEVKLDLYHGCYFLQCLMWSTSHPHDL